MSLRLGIALATALGVLVLVGVAHPTPPNGYRCGVGGKKSIKKEACTCPKGKVAKRDAEGVATCAVKPKVVRAPKPEAVLSGGANEPNHNFGVAVALSADGSRAVIGARMDPAIDGWTRGSARVLVRKGSKWREEAVLRVAAVDAERKPHLGDRVAISADGTRAFIGGAGIRVFVRSGRSWTEEASLVTADGLPEPTAYGLSLSADADGSRVVFGSWSLDRSARPGTARVFARDGDTWTEEATLAVDGGADPGFGYEVALSGDGSRAVVTTLRYQTSEGEAHVFSRTGTVWTEEAALVASGKPYSFGFAVELTGDGSRAVVGTSDAGAWVFVRDGTTWTEEAELSVADSGNTSGLGGSVAVTVDGDRVLVAAYLQDSGKVEDVGHVYVFSRKGATWRLEARLYAEKTRGFGYDVAVTDAGDRALIGVPDDDRGFVFRRKGTRWSR